MLILVDMDDVLADTELGFAKGLAASYPDIPIIPANQRTTFDFDGQYPATIVDKITNAEGYFLNLPMVDGANLALNQMKAQGIDLKICTSPLLSNRFCASEKLQWIARELGQDWCSHTIITRDKTVTRGDLLIDDKPEVTGIMQPTWRHVVFSRPWNISVNTDLRLTHWKDWPKLLELVK